MEFVADGLVNDQCKFLIVHRARDYNFVRVFRFEPCIICIT